MQAIGLVTVGLAAFAACGGDTTTPRWFASDERSHSAASMATPTSLSFPTKQPSPTASPVPTPTPSLYVVTPTPVRMPLPPRVCCTLPPPHLPRPHAP